MCNSCWKTDYTVGAWFRVSWDSPSESNQICPRRMWIKIKSQMSVWGGDSFMCLQDPFSSDVLLVCLVQTLIVQTSSGLKSVWNLVGLFLEGYTVTDTGHNGWSDFSIVWEQKAPKETRWWLPVEPLLVWLCSGVAWRAAGAAGHPATAPEGLSASARPRWVHPLATEMLCHISWGCEWAFLCEPRVSHRLQIVQFCLKLFTYGPKTHCSPKVTLETRYSTSCSAWTSHYNTFHRFELH